MLRRALTGHGVHWDPIEVRLRGERWRFGGNGMAAVARRRLLALLAGRAAESGVNLRFAAPTRLITHAINPTSITAHLAARPLPLLDGPPHRPQRYPWGLRITAPEAEDGLDRAEADVVRGLAAGACLVAVDGGTALTRRPVSEAARLDHGAVTMLIEDGTLAPPRPGQP